jgi:ribonuclease E
MSTVLINAREGIEIRAVSLSNGEIVSYYYSSHLRTGYEIGNIYLGRVVSIERSLDAAFVDIGLDKHAFLPLSNVPPAETGEQATEVAEQKRRHKPKFRKIHINQKILVQIVREAIESKGAQLTGFVVIPGRYLVLSPYERGIRVSRKIVNEAERERLRRIVSDMAPPNFAFIVRTAAEGTRKLELAKDMQYLLRLYKRIDETVKKSAPPSLVYSDADFTNKVVREVLPTDVKQIIVDDAEQFNRLKELLAVSSPCLINSLQLYDSPKPLFDYYGIEEKLSLLDEQEVTLPSGGRIVIEQTEALVSIDVNSGSTKGSNTEETAFQTNLEAVEEIARQLRLRDLGGIIVIDLIDMANKENQAIVDRRLRAAMRHDRAKHTILPTNKLGLLILSRQRLRPSLLETTTTVCDKCNGKKRILNSRRLAAKALRKLQSYLVSNPSEKIKLVVPLNVAETLFNEMRDTLITVEQRFKTKILITSEQLLAGDYQILPVSTP